MNELQANYEGMTKKELVDIIKSQKSELISQETVERNRGAAGTTPQDSDGNIHDPNAKSILNPI
ncbi:hypothetical protein [Enterococcus plantarum]|uniref:hypothetical protein n=1 Tax=Enterococcus plantarum TaxID=1077675 RepID=UPI001A8FBB80|nr:hypothetical protein [Enterococcus plantarum]MBO0423823.1 hypothetical protein [Enterococcus plantarum]